MPYEHEPVKPPPPAPAWTQKPVTWDVAWFVLGVLIVAGAWQRDSPAWQVAVLALLVVGRAAFALRQGIARREAKSVSTPGSRTEVMGL